MTRTQRSLEQRTQPTRHKQRNGEKTLPSPLGSSQGSTARTGRSFSGRDSNTCRRASQRRFCAFLLTPAAEAGRSRGSFRERDRVGARAVDRWRRAYGARSEVEPKVGAPATRGRLQGLARAIHDALESQRRETSGYGDRAGSARCTAFGCAWPPAHPQLDERSRGPRGEARRPFRDSRARTLRPSDPATEERLLTAIGGRCALASWAWEQHLGAHGADPVDHTQRRGEECRRSSVRREPMTLALTRPQVRVALVGQARPGRLLPDRPALGLGGPERSHRQAGLPRTRGSRPSGKPSNQCHLGSCLIGPDGIRRFGS